MDSYDNRRQLVEDLVDAFQEYAESVINTWTKPASAPDVYVVDEERIMPLTLIELDDFDRLSDSIIKVLDDYGIVDIPEDNDLSYVDDQIEQLRNSIKMLLTKKGNDA